MSQQQGNDLVAPEPLANTEPGESAQGTIEDKLNDFIHLVADGWGTEFYDLGRVGKHTTLLDLIERCEADIRKELQAIITTENTKARIDELNRLPRHSKDRWPTSPEFDNVRLALHVPNRLNALQKEQK